MASEILPQEGRRERRRGKTFFRKSGHTLVFTPSGCNCHLRIAPLRQELPHALCIRTTLVFGAQKSPARRAGLFKERRIYRRMRRRTRPAIPIKPAPIMDSVPGSGTDAGGPLAANPVFGPQPPPEAVQKWIAAPVNWLAVRPGAVRTNVSVSALTVPFGAPWMLA